MLITVGKSSRVFRNLNIRSPLCIGYPTLPNKFMEFCCLCNFVLLCGNSKVLHVETSQRIGLNFRRNPCGCCCAASRNCFVVKVADLSIKHGLCKAIPCAFRFSCLIKFMEEWIHAQILIEFCKHNLPTYIQAKSLLLCAANQ